MAAAMCRRALFGSRSLPRAFTSLTLLTHLPYSMRPMTALVRRGELSSGEARRGAGRRERRTERGGELSVVASTFRGAEEERRPRQPTPLRAADTWSRSFTFNRLAIQRRVPAPSPTTRNAPRRRVVDLCGSGKTWTGLVASSGSKRIDADIN